MHPATIIFSYTGFIFFSGIFGWLVGSQKSAFIAATIFAAPMFICGIVCLLAGIPAAAKAGTVAKVF